VQQHTAANHSQFFPTTYTFADFRENDGKNSALWEDMEVIQVKRLLNA